MELLFYIKKYFNYFSQQTYNYNDKIINYFEVVYYKFVDILIYLIIFFNFAFRNELI